MTITRLGLGLEQVTNNDYEHESILQFIVVLVSWIPSQLVLHHHPSVPTQDVHWAPMVASRFRGSGRGSFN